MIHIQLSPITPNPGIIISGVPFTLSYTIDGDDQAPIQITYSLDAVKTVFFVVPDGTKPKTVDGEATILDNPPMQVDEVVTIIKDPPPAGADFDSFAITVTVIDARNGLSDQKTCNVNI